MNPEKIKNALLVLLAIVVIVSTVTTWQFSVWNAGYEQVTIQQSELLEKANEQIRKANTELKARDKALKDADRTIEKQKEFASGIEKLHEREIEQEYWKGVSDGCLNIMLQAGIFQFQEAAVYCIQWTQQQQQKPRERDGGGSLVQPEKPEKGLNSA